MSLPPTSSWPQRFLDLATSLPRLRSRERDAAVAELWAILNVALQVYARRQARALGRLHEEDVREVAAEKASELLVRLDSREWIPPPGSPAQLCAFLAMVARNGVVDFHRIRRREVPVGDGTATDEPESPPPSPETLADAAGYARAILDCSSALTDRARRAWILRVLYELDSADIARDPVVASTRAGVDTMLARCRTRMRACLETKGFALGPLPAGTFVRLWDLVRRTGRP